MNTIASVEFEELYARHKQGVHMFVRSRVHNVDKCTIEDLVSETFFRAWRRIDTFEPGTNFGAWLTVIARNLVFDYFKARARRPDETLIETIFEEIMPLDSTDVERDCIQREQLKGILDCLPEDRKQVLFLSQWTDWSDEDIADYLGMNKATVRTRRFRGIAQLREKYANS